MPKKALVLVISVLLIGVVMAGLQGILNLLSNRGPLDIEATVQPSATAPSDGSSNQPGASIAPQNGNSGSSGIDIPLDISSLSGLASGLPALDLGSEGGLPAHLPLFKLNGSLETPYLRTTAASLYKDGDWLYDSLDELSEYSGDKIQLSISSAARRSLNNMSVTPLANFTQAALPLPVSQYVNKLKASFPVEYDAESNLFISEDGLPSGYSFESINYVFDEATLSEAEVAEDEDSYLDLPDGISAKTLQLAQSITENIDSPYLKAKAIEKYLEDYYQYDYDYQPAPDGSDPVEWFLFDEQKGVCTNFNSAFVVLARASGIPARLVGGYYIDPQAESQTVYADQAHAWAEIKLDKLGWVTIDATGPDLTECYDTQTEITAVSPQVEKSVEFEVQGSVTCTATDVEGVLVELYMNRDKTYVGGTLIGEGLVSANRFTIQAKIPDIAPVGPYQLIARACSTPRFNESVSDPLIKVMSQTDITLSANPRIKTGQVLVIKGQLNELSKLVLTGQTVNLTLNGEPLTALKTDKNGQFEYPAGFDKAGEYQLTAGYAGSDYYFPSEKALEFSVLDPTTLTIAAPQSVLAGDEFEVSGVLTNPDSGEAIAGQKIALYIDDEDSGSSAVTDESGSYVIKSAVKKSGVVQLEARYVSQPYYWESSAMTAVEITARNNQILLGLLLMLAAVLIALAYAMLKYWRKQHKLPFNLHRLPARCLELYHKLVRLLARFKKGKAAESLAPAPDVSEEAETPVEIPEVKIKLEIQFPGITPPLPDVWGINDELDLTCTLLDAEALPMTGQSLEILLGSPIAEITTDDEGKASITLAFTEKGLFDIQANYQPPEENAVMISTVRQVKIVDYREEIAFEYRQFLDWLRGKGLNITSDNTPHEVARMVETGHLPLDRSILGTVIDCFEESSYSTHDIQRIHYVKMRFACEDIKQYEKQGALE